MTPPLRSWRVMHAGEAVPRLALVLQAQLCVGMRPCLVTERGAISAADFLREGAVSAPAAANLLGAWAEVRQWRRSMLELDPYGYNDMVHAHTFAAGMAAVRNFPTVVYELERFVEEPDAGAARQPSGPWLSRSFRVAEQFVISRAAAVVVHSSAARDGVLERGAPEESVFLIAPQQDADPDALRALGESYDAVYRHAASRRGPQQPGNELPVLRPASAY